MAHWTTTDEMSSSIRKEKKNYDISKVTSHLLSKIENAKEELSEQLQRHAVDASVHSDVNKLDLEDLEKLRDTNIKNFEEIGVGIVENLLTTFAWIQLTQLTEIWCMKEEKWLIDTLASLMIADDIHVIEKIQKEILPRMKIFVHMVMNNSLWSICDLRPFQSFVWAMECTQITLSAFRHLFRSLYSTLLVNSSKHDWNNSFNDLGCITEALVCPPFWTTCHQQQTEQTQTSLIGYDMGSPRFSHNVISSCIFKLLGLNTGTINVSHTHPYLTLENFEARKFHQKRLCLQHLQIYPNGL